MLSRSRLQTLVISESSEILSDNISQPSLLATRMNELEQVGPEKHVNRCDTCRRTFNAARGLNQHLRIGKCQDLAHISETDSLRENHLSVSTDALSHDTCFSFYKKVVYKKVVLDRPKP